MSRTFALAFLLVSFLCAPVRAQQVVGSQPANYQPTLDEAIREFSLGNYTESLELFRQSNQLWPNARAQRAIGRCLYELGDYVGAHGALEEALRTSVRPLDPPQRSETEHLLMRVREHLAIYTVVTEPASALVRIDGAPATPDENGHFMLAVGPHAFEATATGFMPAQRQVVAEAQQVERIELRLAPLVSAEAESAPLASDPEPRSDKPLRKKWWLWTSVAGAVAVAAVATVLVVTHDEPEAARPAGGTTGVAIGVLPTASP